MPVLCGRPTSYGQANPLPFNTGVSFKSVISSITGHWLILFAKSPTIKSQIVIFVCVYVSVCLSVVVQAKVFVLAASYFAHMCTHVIVYAYIY